MVKHFFIFIAIILTHTSLNAQSKGNLFIIGGGTRTAKLMQAKLATAQLKEGDYIVVLPMASAETDTHFITLKSHWQISLLILSLILIS